MMPVEKLRGETELASDTNGMKFFLLSSRNPPSYRYCSELGRVRK